MNDIIYTAASGAIINQMRLEILSNNLANLNTAGFKADKSIFKTYLPSSSGSNPSGDMSPNFACNYHVEFEGTKTDFSSGGLQYTGNVLDLALEGDGFFCIKTQDGTRYTRNGNFTLNREGVLVTQDGLPVLGDSGPINIDVKDGGNIVIDEQGNISVDEDQVGTLKIVDFSQPYPLKKMGDTMFAPVGKGNNEKGADNVKVTQGFIELSNVNAIGVMTEMIEVMRGYESYQKVMQFVDNITSKAINEVGRVT